MQNRCKIGILTFGDGRDFLKADLSEVNARFTRALQDRFVKDGFEVVTEPEVIWTNEIAVRAGRRMTAENVHCTVFNFCVWAWPQFARMAAQFCPKPIVMFSNVNPQYPGLVGMLANAGSLDQVGIPFYKVFGDVEDPADYERLKTRILGVSALNRLKGLTYALVGGRSLGIDTAVADPALWMKKFGVDVDHVDQMELVRRAEIEVQKGVQVRKALEYLKAHVRKIHWTAPDAKMRLTEGLLLKQLGMYYGMRDLCSEFGYSFCGIKGQRELTEHYVTADVAEAFLNDPYGPEGEPHEPIICSTEADMDAALTMKVFHLISGLPSLFADIRHYHKDLGVWDLCNSGEHATYFAARSLDPAVNLKKVELRPEGFYFPAGGASVYHIAAPGEVTLGRLTRSGDTNRYRMAIMRGEFVSFGDPKDESISQGVQDNWPHAYAKLACSAETFVEKMHCNHIHGTYGDHVEALKIFCQSSGIAYEVLE